MATVTLTTDQFLDTLRKSGVLEPEPLDRFLGKLAAQPDNARALATALVQARLITDFQARSLLAGKYKGLIVGKYKLLRLLGTGGMGRVYLGEHRTMRSRAALKVLPSLQGGALGRFLREARAAASVNHPNIVRAYDIDQTDGMHFLIMEYVEGATLQSVIAHHGPADPRQAAHWIAQAALGLQHISENGLVHRDIKPSNLMLDPRGVVRIMDLGLALMTGDDADNLTQQGGESGTLGTTDYLCPEQAVSFHDVDIRGDVYSLGATFYFLLTGQTPFAGTTAQKLLHHQMREPLPVSKYRSDVPPDMLAVIAKMMAKSPNDRYQQPYLIAEALLPYAQQGAAMPPPLDDVAVLDGPVTAGTRTTLTRANVPLTAAITAPIPPEHLPNPPIRWPIFAGSFLLLALLGAGSGFWYRHRSQPTLADTKAPVDVAKATPSRSIESGLELKRGLVLGGYGKEIDGLCFAPDGQQFLVTGKNADVFERDTRTGEVVHRYSGHIGDIRMAVYTPDGTQVVSGGSDKTLRVWDRSTGQETRRLPDAGAGIRFLEFAPDGSKLLTCGNDRAITVYDWPGGDIVKKLTGHALTVQCVRILPDGKRAVSCSNDKTLRFWDIATGRETGKVTLDAILHRCALSPDGRFVGLGVESDFTLVSTVTPYEVRKLAGHEKPVTGVQFLPDGVHAITGSHDSTLRLWNVMSGECRMTVPNAHDDRIWTLALAPGGVTLASGGIDTTARLWQLPATLQGGPLRTLVGHTGASEMALLLPGGQRLMSVGQDKTVRWWDAETGAAQRTLAAQDSGVRTLTLHPDGRTALTGSLRGTVVHWGLTAGEPIQTWKVDPGLSCLAWLPDGERFVVGGGDAAKNPGVLQLRSRRDGKVIRSFVGHTAQVTAVLLENDGQTLISAGLDRTVRVWEVATAKLFATYEQPDKIWRLARAPTANRIAFGSGPNVRMLDWKSGQVRTLAIDGAQSVPAVAYTTDGRHMIATSHDGYVRVFRVSDEAEVCRWGGHGSAVISVTVFPDGERILTASRDGAMVLWSLPPALRAENR